MSEQLQQDVFVRNMAALWSADAQLAWRLDALEDEALPSLEPTRSGHQTVHRTTPDGREIYLHSRYDPLAEAQKWVDTNLEDDKYCYFVDGFGLGYHVRALLDRLRGEFVVLVSEPDLACLRQGLTVLDFSEVIRNHRLMLITDNNKNEFHTRVGRVVSLIMLGTKVTQLHSSVQVSGAFFEAMRPTRTDYLSYAKTAMVTLVANSQITCRNIAHNLATYLATPSISILKNRFAGYPAILVSAGPSLRKNQHLLPLAKGRAVILSVQTTFKLLLRTQVVPDFVCSLDYHEVSKQYYDGVEDFQDVHLVAEPKAHWEIIDAYGGPISLLGNDFAKLCLDDAHVEHDSLPAGASVAHLVFYLAEYLGCDPIILVGQDLALTNHLYYAPGMPIHSVWEPEINRFCTMEMKDWEYIVRYKNMLRKVRDWEGREIYTEDLLFNYLEQFERDFARTSARVIDATEGGACKRGVTRMALAEAIETFCQRPIDPALWNYRKKGSWFDPKPLPAARKAMHQRWSEMKELLTLCDETLQTLSELESLLKNPAEFNRKIKKVDRLRLKVREYDRAYRIICAGAQLAEFRKFSADLHIKAEDLSATEKAKRQLQRDQEFVQSFRADTSQMIEIFEQAIERLDRKISSELHSDSSEEVRS